MVEGIPCKPRICYLFSEGFSPPFCFFTSLENAKRKLSKWRLSNNVKNEDATEFASSRFVSAFRCFYTCSRRLAKPAILLIITTILTGYPT